MIGNLYGHTSMGLLKLKANISIDDVLDAIIQFYVDLKYIKSYHVTELAGEDILIFCIVTNDATEEYYFSIESNSFEVLCKLQACGVISR